MTYKVIPVQSVLHKEYPWEIAVMLNKTFNASRSVDEAEQLANDILDLVKRIKTAAEIGPEED